MATQSPRYWFRIKRYGYGWGTPLTWEGWTVMGVFALILIAALGILIIPYEEASLPTSHVWGFIAILALDVLMLLGFSIKYGEPPRWQWGDKKHAPKR